MKERGADKRQNGVQAFMRWTMAAVNAATSCWLLCASYGGCIDPRTWALPSVVGMTLPLIVPVAVVVLVLDLVWWRRQAIFAGLCMLLAAPAMASAFPVNVPRGAMPEKDADRSFTLMTYNVILFTDVTGEYAGGVNQTLSYILREDPDIVCLQEAPFFSRSKSRRISQAQVDSVKSRYSYVSVDGTGQVVFSKFPMHLVHTGFSRVTPGSGEVSVYEVDIRGERVALFNVHLESIGLTDNDKELYGELTRLKGERRIKEVKRNLVGKLQSASQRRAGQIDELLRLIGKYGGETAIVCGDFNDVPGSYGLHALAEVGFREAYPETGLLYMPTYNKDRLLFTIDHVLYRGKLQAYRTKRGGLRTSDHYPLTVTFLTDKD